MSTNKLIVRKFRGRRWVGAFQLVFPEDIEWFRGAGNDPELHGLGRCHLLRELECHGTETRSLAVLLHSFAPGCERYRELQPIDNREFIVRSRDGSEHRSTSIGVTGCNGTFIQCGNRSNVGEPSSYRQRQRLCVGNARSRSQPNAAALFPSEITSRRPYAVTSRLRRICARNSLTAHPTLRGLKRDVKIDTLSAQNNAQLRTRPPSFRLYRASLSLISLSICATASGGRLAPSS